MAGVSGTTEFTTSILARLLLPVLLEVALCLQSLSPPNDVPRAMHGYRRRSGPYCELESAIRRRLEFC